MGCSCTHGPFSTSMLVCPTVYTIFEKQPWRGGNRPICKCLMMVFQWDILNMSFTLTYHPLCSLRVCNTFLTLGQNGIPCEFRQGLFLSEPLVWIIFKFSSEVWKDRSNGVQRMETSQKCSGYVFGSMIVTKVTFKISKEVFDLKPPDSHGRTGSNKYVWS